MSEFKILSFNIHKGHSWNRFVASLPLLKTYLEKEDPDIIFLQEVVGINTRGKYPHALHGSQLDYLRSKNWEHQAYSKNSVHSEGHHGNAILCRYPIVSSYVQDVTLNRFEKRGILASRIIHPKLGEIYLYCVHFNLLERDRIKQCLVLCDLINRDVENNAPYIIAGDFNDWTKKSAQLLEEKLGVQEVHKLSNGHYATTFPALFPFLSLDRIFVKNLNVLESGVVQHFDEKLLSDHLGIYAKVS